MDPDAYRDKYLEPFGGHYEAGATPSLETLFFLADRCYHDEGPPRLPLSVYNLLIDKLTRDELLQLIGETGYGDPAAHTTAELIGVIGESNRVNEVRRLLLIEREAELAALRQDLEGLLNSRSYRLYRTMMLPLRAGRRLWRTLWSAQKRRRA